MAFHRNLLSFFFFFIIMISFVACYSKLQEDNPLLMYVHHEDESSINDGGAFKNLIKQTADHVLSLKSFDKLGAVTSSSSSGRSRTVNVNNYGAKGDGATDDSQAFEKAWKVACSSVNEAILVVPKKNYLLKPMRFTGPCKSDIALEISGTIKASDNPSDYSEDPTHWLRFDSIKNFSVQGGGTIDGNGNIWWKNSCKTNQKLPCKDAPTAVIFYKCQNLMVEDLKIQNGQQIHVSIQDSTNVKVSGLTVTAPEDSPNTDGIHVTNTQNIQISSTIIGTGDDCISIVSGSQNVQVTDITCGPGHGISIGSLGSGKSKEFVSGVTVNGAKLSGTTNGVRIKTWQGGSGSASNIKFQNIQMDNVTNPIIIDQNYCDQKTPCKEQRSGVQIRNVLYKNIKGTSASDVAVKLDCSQSFPCQGIVLQNIDLQRQGTTAKSSCDNVKLSYMGVVSPRCS